MSPHLIAACTEAEIRLLAMLGDECRVAPDEILAARAGYPGPGVVLVIHGMARVERAGRVIDYVAEGDVLGLAPAAGEVIAATEMRLLRFERETFDRALASLETHRRQRDALPA